MINVTEKATPAGNSAENENAAMATATMVDKPTGGNRVENEEAALAEAKTDADVRTGDDVQPDAEASSAENLSEDERATAENLFEDEAAQAVATKATRAKAGAAFDIQSSLRGRRFKFLQITPLPYTQENRLRRRIGKELLGCVTTETRESY